MMKDLLFKDFLNGLSDVNEGQWITVYKEIEEEDETGGILAILVSRDYTPEVLSSPGWPVNITSFRAGYVHYADEAPKYCRFGLDVGVEPLILQRFYNNVYPTSLELIEEFRHYFNLYFDSKTSYFISLSEVSEEREAVYFTEGEIRIRKNFLKEFLAAKKMNLCILFDVFRYTSANLEKHEVSLHSEFDYLDESLSYILNFQDSDYFQDPAKRYNARLLGKLIFSGYSSFQPKSWIELLKDRKYASFIIGEDERGQEVEYSCSPSLLRNTDTAVDFLKPVFFQKDVLKRYYDRHDKYLVEDGSIRFIGGSRLPVDNNHEKYVICYLGDLGTNLLYEEQCYWRGFNVVPDGKMSRVHFHRDYLSVPHPPEAVDLIFKIRYEEFQRDWYRAFGFYLFLPLKPQDSHHFSSLHTPLNDSILEFEQQILSLSKLLSDSINQREIEKLFPETSAVKGGIKKLAIFLSKSDFGTTDLEFLISLQRIRSVAVAHRKGEDFRKLFTDLKMDERTYGRVFDGL